MEVKRSQSGSPESVLDVGAIGTLPETNIAHENPIFPGKYHQNCGFSMAMLVSGSVFFLESFFLI